MSAFWGDFIVCISMNSVELIFFFYLFAEGNLEKLPVLPDDCLTPKSPSDDGMVRFNSFFPLNGLFSFLFSF